MLSRLKVSFTNFFLINLSKGVSVIKLGLWFTYKRYGYNSLFKIMSNPKIWKHISL